MAKLSANGTEQARLRATAKSGELGTEYQSEYSIRSNGTILRKARTLHPGHRSTWGAWVHAWAWSGEPERLGILVGRMREHLARQGYAVSDITPSSADGYVEVTA